MTVEEKQTIDMLQRIRESVESGALTLEQFPMEDLYNLMEATMGMEYIGVTGGMESSDFAPILAGYRSILEHCIEENDVSGCVKAMGLLQEQYVCLDRMLSAYRDMRFVEPYKKVTAGAGEAYSEVQHYMHEKKRKKDMTSCDLGKNGKGVVYTCAFFCTQGLQQPEYINLEWDYICFTDDKEKIGTKEGVWEYRGFGIEDLGSRELLFRMCALKPHVLLPEYDFSIWVNSNYRIAGDLELYMASYGRNTSFLAFPSYITDDIYDMLYTNMDGDDTNIQVRKKKLQYQKEGYPAHDCMISDAIIIRNHRDAKMCQVMETWWNEAMQCGRLWEYGFNYSAWKHDFDYALCDLFVEMNPYFKSMLIDLEVKVFE